MLPSTLLLLKLVIQRAVTGHPAGCNWHPAGYISSLATFFLNGMGDISTDNSWFLVTYAEMNGLFSKSHQDFPGEATRKGEIFVSKSWFIWAEVEKVKILLRKCCLSVKTFCEKTVN